jgi:hypothetical protein
LSGEPELTTGNRVDNEVCGPCREKGRDCEWTGEGKKKLCDACCVNKGRCWVGSKKLQEKQRRKARGVEKVAGRGSVELECSECSEFQEVVLWELEEAKEEWRRMLGVVEGLVAKVRRLWRELAAFSVVVDPGWEEKEEEESSEELEDSENGVDEELADLAEEKELAELMVKKGSLTQGTVVE